MSKTGQDLTGTAGGVPAAGGAATQTAVEPATQPATPPAAQPRTDGQGGPVVPAAPGTAAPAAPAKAAVQEAGAVDLTKIDLSEIPAYRRYQADRDRSEAALKKRVETLEQQNTALSAQVEQVQLSGADPEQQAAYYKGELARTKAQQQAMVELQAQEEYFNARAAQLLQESGLSATTPGLDFSKGPTPEGYALLAESVARLARQQAIASSQQQQQATLAASQAGAAQALEQAGVTRVSAVAGAGAPSVDANPIAGESNPDTLLKMAMDARRKAEKGGRP